MGVSGQLSGWSYNDPANTANSSNWSVNGGGNVWILGYDPERWTITPDATTLSTLIRGGNYDFLQNQVSWTTSLPSQTLPNSLYLKSKPAFFGNDQWPWVDPTGSTQVYTLPARARYDAGTPFAAAPGASQ